MMRSKRYKLLFCLVNVFIPLMIGLVYYLVFRPYTYLSLLFKQLFGVTAKVSIKPNPLIDNYICDLLWSYSTTYLIAEIAQKHHIGKGDLIIILGVLISLPELLQYFQIITGTADFIDVIVQFIGCVLALVIQKYMGGSYYAEQN